jgi:hypothetical protein
MYGVAETVFYSNIPSADEKGSTRDEVGTN